jgi:aspartyl-tRNA(Asn)/glutamyl-tRNA(Gln) amidotransferase subunit A
MTDPTDLTAAGLLEAYRSGTLSPVETAQAHLDRIAALDHTYNAFCHLDPDVTLAQAKASEQRWQAHEPQGLLDGVPVAVKDVFQTIGWPTLRGSRTVDPNQRWDVDAPAVAALRRHGAVLAGKTTTPEIGWKAVTDSPLHDVTRNPWNTDRTAGGSSGGSSAALAARMTPLALGTDGGGSIRIPCSFCNLAGIKPTHGRVPLWPASPFGTLAHAGPMARTVTDTALLLTALAEPDPRDPTALPPESGSYTDDLDAGVAGLSIGYSRDLGFIDVDPSVLEVTDAAARSFADLGARVDDAGLRMDDPLETFTTLWNSGAANALRHLDDAGRALLDPGLAAAAEDGRRHSALDYLAAANHRAQIAIAMNRYHLATDLLITPAVAVPPFAANRDVPDGWADDRWPSWAPFSFVFNLTGQPAAVVPCGFTPDGLPVGLQIVGPKYSDALVLRAARAYERANPLFDRLPPLPNR